MASPQVIWNALRYQDAAVVRRDGITFATGSRNVSNLHGLKHVTAAQARTVGVQVRRVKEGEKKRTQIVLIKSKAGVAAEVTKLPQKPAAAADAIKAAVSGFRPDLLRAALARYSKLKKSLGVKKAIAPRRSTRKE